MSRKIQIDQLKRIVAMLFALADLAGRTSRAPYPVRCLVLSLLRPAEGAARAFIVPLAGSMENTKLLARASVRTGNEPLDALHLAGSFQTLALVLANLPAQNGRLALWSARRDGAGANDSTRDGRRGSCRKTGLAYRPLPLLAIAITQRLDTS